jgi:hypothetical protein
MAEIDRRSAEIEGGTATFVDWADVRRELFKRVGRTG